MPTERVITAGVAQLDTAVQIAAETTPHTTGNGRALSTPQSRFTPIAGPWVVVPTYNEIDNLGTLLGQLLAELREAVGTGCFSILVVDDGSPDGTGQLADELATDYPEVQVLHRTAKNGLGQAYLAGFRIALDHGATHVIQMDADRSHDPAAVPALLEVAKTADLVLGSRYVRGGETPGWSRKRRILSRGGSFYARRVLGLQMRDLTGGFKCWSRQTLMQLGLGDIEAEGYVFQIEMTYRAVQAGARVAEMPITFRDRTEGESKMSGSIVSEALMRVPQLRFGAKRSERGSAVMPALEPALAES